MSKSDLILPEGMENGPKERRRQMSAGQARNTPLGVIKFKITVDLPAALDDEGFRKAMGEYAAILGKTFPYQGGLQER